MAEQVTFVQNEHCETLQEEVVDTSYVCGECFHVFSTMVDFTAHCCTMSGEGAFISQDDSQYHEQVIHEEGTIGTRHAETEADMEAAVASILVEKMKQKAPQKQTFPVVHLEEKQLEEVGSEHLVEPSVEHTSIIDYQTEADPLLHIVEHTDQLEPGMIVESMEIPSTNVYIYDNPFYLNRLMKDNTCGRRARHDAPYTHRLGPWDDRSSRLLIQLLKEYPKAFFIMGKNSKRTEAWEMIRYKLSEAGYQFTVLQIRMRWRELCKRYRNVVNHNDLQKTRRTCQFFEELNDLFGIWDSRATEILIKELGANGTKRLGQNGGTRMRYKAWQQISDVLAKNGYEFTADQVHGRWNALVMLYRRMVNYNANPNNEPITIAFKESVETVFSYTPDGKIFEKCEKQLNERMKWTPSLERCLLTGYKNLVESTSKEQAKYYDLWQKIAVHLEEKAGYVTTTERVKTRFYELTKQYAAMLQHNSDPGTLYRESRHHEILADIYNRYNCWPHDGSTIKLDKSNAIRLRQLDAQLLWTEEESIAVLQLYPKVLLDHISNSDQPQPPEELWVQLAKALYAADGYVKAPYEIEEHITLLRRGHKSSSRFPFQVAMDLLEETETSLCFSPESPSRDSDQLLPYWSHEAARLMLDLVIHYRQEGIKMMTDNLFEVISRNMEEKGYSYTADECREYFFLLQKIYKNRLYNSKKKLTENSKMFPYMDRMNELRMVSNQPGMNRINEKYSAVLTAAACQLTAVKECDKESRRRALEIALLNCKMHIRDVVHIRPPPSIRELAGLLLAVVKSKCDEPEGETENVKKLTEILRPHLDVLDLISENGAIHIYHDYQAEALKSRDKVFERRKMKAIGVQWTNDNTRIMLETIKEWLLLCHDNQEMEEVLGCSQPLWEEVAYKLSRRFNKCPQICWQYFIRLRREYMAALTSKGSLKYMPSLKTSHCQELLQDILSFHVSHDGEWDERDARWMQETGGWGCKESIDLLFTVREFWPGEETVNWKMISLMMHAGGFKRDAKSCYKRFKQLYGDYQKAFKHSQQSSIRDRQRSSFYYKIHSLFGYRDDIPLYYSDSPCQTGDYDIDEEELIEVLLAGMKEIKNLSCHSVPRIPLLQALAQYMDFHCPSAGPSLNIHQIWKYLVQVHHAQMESVQQGVEGPLGMDLDGLWVDNPNPLVAFGVHCIPYPKWEVVSEWSLEELEILVDTIVKWEGTTSDNTQIDESLLEDITQQLQTHGYDKSSDQCREQWQYMIMTYSHGGYQNFKSQINLVYLFQPFIIQSALYSSDSSVKSQNQQYNMKDEKVLVFSDLRDSSLIKTNEIHTDDEHYSDRSLDSSSDFQGQKGNGNDADKGMGKIMNSERSIGKMDEYLSFVHDTMENSKIQMTSSMNEVSQESNPKESKVSVANDQIERHILQKKEENGCSKEFRHNETNCDKDLRVKAKVISISEFPESKIIMCQVQKNEETQILKLHYPVSYNIPNNIRYLYIPKNIVCPENKLQTEELNTDSYNTEVKITENTAMNLKGSMKHKKMMKVKSETRPKNIVKKDSCRGLQMSAKRASNIKHEESKYSKKTRRGNSTYVKELKREVHSSEEPVKPKAPKTGTTVKIPEYSKNCDDVHSRDQESQKVLKSPEETKNQKSTDYRPSQEGVECFTQGTGYSHAKESIEGDEGKEGNMERMRKAEEASQGILQLAVEYHQQCDREDERFASLMKESQEEFAVDFQKVLSSFHELSDFL
ncbi:uncharacterized protein LOC122257176 isoform X2 [Penaeus japonicus]|uniref:uncharacterized protein LOC122257176 isoform X2 n=1 Tax=Penaeus japonicus TaxID=27405 RepID=UPI001C70EB00|nr:uncharacterized protein LOC122257176 isoform X2 [Penaeus japonicus]